LFSSHTVHAQLQKVFGSLSVVARARARGTGQVLWVGATGETVAHAAVPWLVFPRKYQPN